MRKEIHLLFILSLIINYSLLAESLPYRNVVYYGDWSVYNKYYPSMMESKAITHVNFAFLDMDSNGDLKIVDEYADFQIATLPELEGLSYGEPYAGVLGAFAVLKTNNPHIKIGISVGGWGKSANFHEVAGDKVKRQNFATNIVKFIDYLGFDFVDIDWEHPTIEREGCPGGPEDTENFTLLMKELRNALDQLENKNGKHYELSIAMSAELDLLPTIQYDKVLNYVDFINMMTYDLSGSWNSYTSHQTPLYTNKAYNKNTMSGAKNSADACITYFEETYGSTIDMSKILIGVAAYTRGWAKVQDDGLDKNNPGLYATAARNSVINSDGNEGIYPFRDIEEIIQKYDLNEYFDNTAKAAYYYSAKNGYFFTCDNEQSVEAKGNYVRKKGLGGLIMWMASQDNNNKLQKAMFKSLFGENYSLPSQKPVYTYPNAKINIVQTDSGCEITVVNNEEILENNLALKTAELFQKSILFFKLYIKTESGIKCSAGTGSGTIVNNDGICIIDPSSNSEARIISPGNNYKFKIKVSSALTKSEIVSIKMTQRITPSSKEFKEQTLSSL